MDSKVIFALFVMAEILFSSCGQNGGNAPNYVSSTGFLTHFGATTIATGGSNAGSDPCNAVAVDGSGNVYCAGGTTGAMGETNGGGQDAFVMKLNSSGTLQWLTHFGNTTKAPGGSNSSNDSCNGVAVDSSGNVYCAGSTSSAMGETGGGSADAFVMKLNSSGTLQWLKHFGNTTTAPGGSNASADICNSVAVDSSGNVYCGGQTQGAMGETNGGGTDAVVMKLNSSGTLQWLTHFGNTTIAPGGSNAGTDICYGIAVDTSGNVYCAGQTTGAMGETHGGGTNDAFVMKLNSSGSLQWLTHFGNTTKASGGSNAGGDYCTGVAVDGSGNVYCSGLTSGAMAETSGGSNDAFVMKLNSSGTLQWLTHFGNTTKAPSGSNAGNDSCKAVSVNSSGNVYCAGLTTGAMGETVGGSVDAFVLKLNSSGTLQWLTQFGNTTTASGGSNSGSDSCNGVAVDTSGNVYCAGQTAGDMGETNGGADDAFVLKLKSSGDLE